MTASNTEKFTLTSQQKAVIEYQGAAPALVIAGAGSGKTTTMAQRVAYLIEHSLVQPHEILGLTFTRKATSELRKKITKELTPEDTKQSFGGGLDQPTIMTYNAFAARVFQENALIVGREPDAILLSEPGAWELAYQIVKTSQLPLGVLGKSVSAIASAVITVAHGMSEHSVAISDIAAAVADFPDAADIGFSAAQRKELGYLVEAKQGLPMIAQLAKEYDAVKRRQGYIEYSDQVSLALQAVTKHAQISADYREQYKVILLDEYQDTSVQQAQFLSALFAGQQVMAVGDPFQAIYGWRGASADAFNEFNNFFAVNGQKTKLFQLTTSWRNDTQILDAANAIADPLRVAESAATTNVKVEKLKPSKNANEGDVSITWTPTQAEEAARLASWFSKHLKPKTTAALLSRTKGNIDTFCEALENAGVPYVVLGATGVLEAPEVVDVLSALAVIQDMSAGAELVRLLAGAKWRLGLADLEQLHALASRMRRFNIADLYADDRSRQDTTFEADTSVGIVDALDEFAWRDQTHKDFAGFSEVGRARLADAARVFRTLRRNLTRDVAATIKDVVSALDIDIELYANPALVRPMANIDALVDYAQSYMQAAQQPTIAGLLNWLSRLKNDSEFNVISDDPERGVVQVLTVHSAKGLEWDIVAVPGMVTDTFPNRAKYPYAWLGFREIPYPTRADKKSLPQLKMRPLQGTSKPEVTDYVEQISDFSKAVKDHNETEERRVAYVATTRAKHKLFLSGSVYKSAKAGTPSVFLKDAAKGLGIDDGFFDIAAEKPEGQSAEETMIWPFDPLGSRRPQYEAAESAILDASSKLTGYPTEDDVLTELLSEYESAQDTTSTPTVYRLSTSGLHEFMGNAEHSRKIINGYLRPIPNQPFKASVLGTRFHAWVEAHYKHQGATALLDVNALEDDDDLVTGNLTAAEEATLAKFQDTFLASQYASMTPIGVEEEFTAMIGTKRLSAKLDAVFQLDDGTIQIVDWKTGKAPKTPSEKAQRILQLEVYRAVYAKARKIDIDTITATLYYIADDFEYSPSQLRTEDELAKVISQIPVETAQ